MDLHKSVIITQILYNFFVCVLNVLISSRRSKGNIIILLLFFGLREWMKIQFFGLREWMNFHSVVTNSLIYFYLFCHQLTIWDKLESSRKQQHQKAIWTCFKVKMWLNSGIFWRHNFILGWLIKAILVPIYVFFKIYDWKLMYL